MTKHDRGCGSHNDYPCDCHVKIEAFKEKHDREAIARLIDPAWWAWFDVHGDLEIAADRKRHAFLMERADAIRAFINQRAGLS